MRPLPLLLPLLLLAAAASSPAPAAEARAAFACAPGEPATSLPFCNRSLPLHARASDLVSRLTRAEKVRLLVNNAAGGVPRLGVAGYEWWSEALHGVSDAGPGVAFGGAFPGATAFPQVLGTAAALNASLWERIGQETPGEDPTISSRYAVAYVQGLQQQLSSSSSTSNRGLKVAACCKHFTAYDLDQWGGTDRYHFNAIVSPQDLEDTFNVPFRACVTTGNVAAVMCSYNQVNGVPTCADESFLKGMIRGDWGLDGYIVSGCDSVDAIFNDQHYTRTAEDAAAAALRAGLDLYCGRFLALYTEPAVAERKLTDADVDAAVTNTVTVQLRLGLFDGETSTGPYGHLGPKDVCTPDHQQLVLEAARQGAVLLKNDDKNGLPLRAAAAHRTVAVVGPHTDATVAMIGNYAGKACRYTTPLQGVAGYVEQAVHAAGCADVACVGTQQPVMAAIDATVDVAGLDQKVEAKGLDRSSLLLPGRQAELISAMAKASKGPVILVIMSGGPVDIAFAQNDPRIAAILWAGYPGQAGGQAIAVVILGHHNPGGKLPVTWYPEDYLQKAPMTNMAMRANPATKLVCPPPTTKLECRFSLTHSVFLFSTCVHCEGATSPSRNLSSSSSSVPTTAAAAPSLKHRAMGRAARFLTAVSLLVAFEKVHVAAAADGMVRVEVAVDVCEGMSVADWDGEQQIPVGEHGLTLGYRKERTRYKQGKRSRDSERCLNNLYLFRGGCIIGM
ncbi:unnamed protein product [Urochloa decumbens]|uniref:Uncharacterized protein n=1 Tax=Urochloa decumbens TaxID=240449 RepID=A0ABC9B1V2_9POAL